MINQFINSQITKNGNNLIARLLSKPVILSSIFRRLPRDVVVALVHEIRNPLTTINLALAVLQLTSNMEEQKKMIAIITRSSVRINSLVNDLLIAQNNSAAKSEVIMVSNLLEEVVTLTADRALLKNITIYKKWDAAECAILGNKQQIKMVLANIIVNAIDAIQHNNGELELVIKKANGKCNIEIADNGAGISKDNLRQLFKPYFTKKPHGIGLGLSASLNILYAHHAKINVQYEEGRGTRFIRSFKMPDRQSMRKQQVTSNDFLID